MRIELVIDELRLHGFDARHRHAVADSVEREAAALIAAHVQGLAGATSGTTDLVDAGPFDPGPDAASAGRAIARVVIDTVVARAGAPPASAAGALSPSALTPSPASKNDAPSAAAAPEGGR